MDDKFVVTDPSQIAYKMNFKEEPTEEELVERLARAAFDADGMVGPVLHSRYFDQAKRFLAMMKALQDG